MSLNPSRAAMAVVLLLVIVPVVPVFADAALNGEVRFQAVENSDQWVGEQRELQLELWTNGFSFSDQLFVLPEVRGGYLLQPDSSTTKLSENRNGVQWQGLRYTLLFYPQRAGLLEVPSFDVSFSARAGFGAEPARFRYRTDPLQIEAQLPPGAQTGKLLVTTSSFTLDSGWTPQTEAGKPMELKVGDAISLTVTRRARDVPGMVFEPLPEFDIDGLSVYPDSPQINDRVNRGSLAGERIDHVTFICEREGTFRIPGMGFQWWDPRSERLADHRIEPIEVVVAVNPALARGGPAPAARKTVLSGSRGVLVVAATVLILALAWFVAWPRLRQYRARRRIAYEAGESWAFRRVRQACESNHPVQAYNAITLWLSRLQKRGSGSLLTELAKQAGDKDLIKEATALQQAVASGLTKGWKGGKLAQLLAQLREGQDQSGRSLHALQALNPSLSR